ncbi:MAG: hypothetical protein M1820_003299 [Bogoriella megaspora]|nr:MAG: hypothetical protein M1820_003299 [Bogoriella megaspora]
MDVPAETLAKSIAAYIPPSQRSVILSQVADCFDDKRPTDNNTVLTALAGEISSSWSDLEFLEHLHRLITRDGRTAFAADLCIRRPASWSFVENRASESFWLFLKSRNNDFAWLKDDSRALSDSLMNGVSGQQDKLSSDLSTERYLQFLKFYFWSSQVEITMTLLIYLLALLDSMTDAVQRNATDAVFALLASIKNRTCRIQAPQAHAPHRQAKQENHGSELDQDGKNETEQDSDSESKASNIIWGRVLSLTSKDWGLPNRYTGLQLRLRWTALPSMWRPQQKVLCQDEYWDSLQNGLCAGSSEQKKICLYLLRLSIQILDSDVKQDHIYFSRATKAEFEIQYDRFCAVYETLVLSRYINQVEECKSDLVFLASSQCLVHKSWFYAMLQAALDPATQDSVRNFTGRFVSAQIRCTSQGYYGFIRMFEAAYLPWATQGRLYAPTLITRDETYYCTHGEAVKEFVHRAIVDSWPLCYKDISNEGPATIVGGSGSRQRIPEIIICALMFVAEKDTSLFAYAGAYILTGVLSGIEAGLISPLSINAVHKSDTFSFCLSRVMSEAEVPADASIIKKIANRSDLPEIVRDVYRFSCERLMELMFHRDPHVNKSSTSIPSDSPGDLGGSRDAKGLGGQGTTSSSKSSLNKARSAPDFWTHQMQLWQSIGQWDPSPECSPQDLRVPAVAKVVSIIHTSEYRCLRGDGLDIACDYFSDALDCGLVVTTASDLQFALEAIWAEIEIQDYPKRMLLRFPHLLLHETCFPHLSNSASDTNDLKIFTKKVIAELHSLAEGRIYVFGPLAKALRKAIFQEPSLAEALSIDEFVAQFAKSPPVPKFEFQFEAALVPILRRISSSLSNVSYEDYYGLRDGYGYACVIDLVNRIQASQSVLKRIFNDILHLWTRPRRKLAIVNKWKTTLQLRIILIIIDPIIDQATDTNQNDEIGRYFEEFLEVLSSETLPQYRFLLEWISIRFLIKDVVHRKILLDRLASESHSNPKWIASLIKMAVMTACLGDSSPTYVLELAALLVAVTASPKIAIRHEAQLGFSVLWDHAVAHSLSNVTSNPAFSSLNEIIRGVEKLSKAAHERKKDFLDPVNDMTIANITQGSHLKLYPIEKQYTKSTDFTDVVQDTHPALLDSNPLRIPLGNFVYESNSPSADADLQASVPEASNGTLDSSNSIPIQTKGAAWQTNLLKAADSCESNNHNTRSSLILVASLISNPFNLGGLCRVAEIFGVQEIHVASTDVLSSKDFLSVSVTSERHLRITETPLQINQRDESGVDALAQSLLSFKKKGYSVVGLEQTDSSVLLGSDAASRVLQNRQAGTDSQDYGKVVIVLGSESLGMPAWVLKECDSVIEIPQLGVVRSMNVQTAAAVVLFEYTRLRNHSRA